MISFDYAVLDQVDMRLFNTMDYSFVGALLSDAILSGLWDRVSLLALASLVNTEGDFISCPALPEGYFCVPKSSSSYDDELFGTQK